MKRVFPLLAVLAILSLSGCVQNESNLSLINASNNTSVMINNTSSSLTGNETQSPGLVGFVYTASCKGLNFSSKPSLEVIPGDSGFKFTQNIPYYCCANITIDFDISGRNITILEKNTGEICKCMCNYEVSGKFYNLPSGDYNFTVMGIEYNDNQTNVHFPAKTLFTRKVHI